VIFAGLDGPGWSAASEMQARDDLYWQEYAMKQKDDQRPIPACPDSMGPDINSGGVQDVGGLVPPYQGRKMHGVATTGTF
jgi:hypothetical protein